MYRNYLLKLGLSQIFSIFIFLLDFLLLRSFEIPGQDFYSNPQISKMVAPRIQTIKETLQLPHSLGILLSVNKVNTFYLQKDCLWWQLLSKKTTKGCSGCSLEKWFSSTVLQHTGWSAGCHLLVGNWRIWAPFLMHGVPSQCLKNWRCTLAIVMPYQCAARWERLTLTALVCQYYSTVSDLVFRPLWFKWIHLPYRSPSKKVSVLCLFSLVYLNVKNG